MLFCHIGNSKKWSCTIIFNRNSLLTIDQSRKQKENFCNSYTISKKVLFFFFLFSFLFFPFFLQAYLLTQCLQAAHAVCLENYHGGGSERPWAALELRGVEGNGLCLRAYSWMEIKMNTPSPACLAMGKRINSQMERLDFKLGKPNLKCK